MQGWMKIIKLLIAKGTDINLKNNDAETPLHIAISCDQQEVARWLIENKADISIKNKFSDFKEFINIPIFSSFTIKRISL